MKLLVKNPIFNTDTSNLFFIDSSHYISLFQQVWIFDFSGGNGIAVRTNGRSQICIFALLDLLYFYTSSHTKTRAEASRAATSTNCMHYYRNHDGPSSTSPHHSQVPSFSTHIVRWSRPNFCSMVAVQGSLYYCDVFHAI